MYLIKNELKKKEKIIKSFEDIIKHLEAEYKRLCAELDEMRNSDEVVIRILLESGYTVEDVSAATVFNKAEIKRIKALINSS